MARGHFRKRKTNLSMNPYHKSLNVLNFMKLQDVRLEVA